MSNFCYFPPIHIILYFLHYANYILLYNMVFMFIIIIIDNICFGGIILKFNEMPYTRPDLKKFEAEFNTLLKEFSSSQTFTEQDSVMEKINAMRKDFQTMEELANIRYTINTEDKFYKEEEDFFDNNLPVYNDLVAKFCRILVKSKFRKQLEEKWGKQIFTLAEVNMKTISPEVIEDLKLENKLTTDYVSLIASAKIMFEGEERTIPQMAPFELSKDRNMRKSATDAKFNFFRENEDKIDEIYDNLVKVRTKIAKKLGFDNFIELAYARLGRSDYNPDMVADFRKQVLKYIVPVAVQLKDRQRKRLELDKITYYDDKYYFNTGNAVPKGTPEYIVDCGRKMYSELSPETDEFFKFMTENELLDLLSKKGKAGGGYCTFIFNYKSPFIFANFNGTADDVNVITHEAGHAFEAYCSRKFDLPEYAFPTCEAAEIHSSSMEFFTWPWMELFFKEDSDKYRFSHLADVITFIPYGVTVDEFQHFVYANPDISPAERKRAWRQIEKKYLPYLDYEGNDFLERGGYWFRQSHIFEVPFYYIDYTLAYMCSLQFWKKSSENRKAAWDSYVTLCKAGGSQSFLNLVKTAGLVSPFDNNCIKGIIGDVENWLNKVDDSKL